MLKKIYVKILFKKKKKNYTTSGVGVPRESSQVAFHL